MAVFSSPPRSRALGRELAITDKVRGGLTARAGFRRLWQAIDATGLFRLSASPYVLQPDTDPGPSSLHSNGLMIEFGRGRPQANPASREPGDKAWGEHAWELASAYPFCGLRTDRRLWISAPPADAIDEETDLEASSGTCVRLCWAKPCPLSRKEGRCPC